MGATGASGSLDILRFFVCGESISDMRVRDTY